MKLTVVVLVYNEIRTLKKALEDAKAIGIQDKEIIVIDNGSTDGSRQFLESLNDQEFRIIFNQSNLGPGKSVQIGIREARGEFIYIHHSDLEYDHNDAVKMLEAAEKHNLDVVLGSRIKDYSRPISGLIKERPEYIATVIATFLINLWYKREFTDVIGSKLYRSAAISRIPISTYGVGFEFEHISRICKMKLNTGEISVRYLPRTFRRDKKIKPCNLINALISLFKVRYFR